MPACPKPDKPIRDKAHLKFVAGLPCCITGRTDGVEAHHLLRGTGEKCGSRKSGDNWVIPMEWTEHTALHAWGHEKEWLGWSNIDGPALAKALYEVTGDYEVGVRVVMERMET